MKNFGKLAVLGAALAVSATYASATTIPTGSFVLGPSVGSYTGSLTGTGSITPGFTVNYTETVYDYTSGGKTYLAFEYAVTNTTPTLDVIETLSTNYGKFADSSLVLQDVSGDSLAGNYAASGSISIQWAGGGLGSASIGGSGSNSSDFILFTDATQYGPGPISFINTDTANGSALVPSTPEPSSLMLLGTGLLSGAGMLMRRRRLTA